MLVVDVNDNAPRFSHAHYDARVTENRPPGDVIARPTASDRDTGRNADIRYTPSADLLDDVVIIIIVIIIERVLLKCH